MKTYFIGIDNMVAVQAETEQQAKEAALEELTEILQRDQVVCFNIELED